VPALFCAHLLEHLPAGQVERLYAAAGRALAPGGVFVAAVPNAACLSVLGYDFWRDPTHVRFYDPMVLAFFADRAGLVVTETGGNPNNHPGPPPQLQPPPLAGQPGLGEEVGRVVRLASAQAGDTPADRPAGGTPAGGTQVGGTQVGGPAGGASAAGPAGASPADGPRSRAPDGRDTDRQDTDGRDTDGRDDGGRDNGGAPWPELGHLIGTLDQRLQAVQHQLATLQAAYQNLLAQLYPPNEVYVVARKPGLDG